VSRASCRAPLVFGSRRTVLLREGAAIVPEETLSRQGLSCLKMRHSTNEVIASRSTALSKERAESLCWRGFLPPRETSTAWCDDATAQRARQGHCSWRPREKRRGGFSRGPVIGRRARASVSWCATLRRRNVSYFVAGESRKKSYFVLFSDVWKRSRGGRFSRCLGQKVSCRGEILCSRVLRPFGSNDEA
jgi:hypothetical protein